MKSNLLSEIVALPAAVPAARREIEAIPAVNGIEDPRVRRLSTAQLLTTLQQLGTALANAGEAFAKMPGATPDQLPGLLEQIIKQAAGAQAKAERLLAANR